MVRTMNDSLQAAGSARPGGTDRPVAVELELRAVRVPFSGLAQKAMDSSANGLGMAIAAEEPWEAGDFVIARLVDEAGTEGWAEIFVWLPETGVSPEEMLLSVPRHLARYVLGRTPADVRAIRARMDRNVARNDIAKGLLDLACHDLAARQVGRPVHDLLGGRAVDEVALCGLVPLVDPETVVAICAGYVADGYRTLRIKLGSGPEADRAVIAAVRAEVGDDVRLRVDYNQAYRAPEAARALQLLEPYGIDAAEQPLPIGDLVGMVEVQRRTSIPLFLHEGGFDVADVVGLAELGGCGVVGLNMERPGGLVAAGTLVDWASARGMGVVVHNQCLGLGTAAHLHLVAARHHHLGHDVELAGEVEVAHQLVVDGPRPVKGRMAVPTGPGWGVEVDRDALEDHTVAEPVTVHLDDLLAPDRP